MSKDDIILSEILAGRRIIDDPIPVHRGKTFPLRPST